MALQSLTQVLNAFEQQEQLRSRRRFQSLLSQWPQLVGEAVAAQTRPLSIHQDVLQVATASSAWAQNLMFERQRLLQKINTQLGLNLKDIRFSTAQWSTVKGQPQDTDQAVQQLWRDHPSRISASVAQEETTHAHQANEAGDPNVAFQQWAKIIQARSQQLPLCPSCQCPTPSGELARWSVCALCAAKQW